MEMKGVQEEERGGSVRRRGQAGDTGSRGEGAFTDPLISGPSVCRHVSVRIVNQLYGSKKLTFSA